MSRHTSSWFGESFLDQIHYRSLGRRSNVFACRSAHCCEGADNGRRNFFFGRTDVADQLGDERVNTRLVLHQLAETLGGPAAHAERSGVGRGLDKGTCELRVEGPDQERDLFEHDCQGL